MVEEELKSTVTLQEGEEPIQMPPTSEGVNLNCRFYKDPFPKKDELVVVQVQNVNDMGAYVSLLEYNGLEGMILMSELSRKRIRSVKRLIRVGRLEVVVVLRVDESRGYIDLSKKRVSPEEIQRCETRFNKSKAVHTILRNVAQITSTNIEILYQNIAWPLYEQHYEHPYDAFCQAVVAPDTVFAGLTLSNDVRMQLTAVVRRRLTPQPVKIRSDFEVTCYEYEGIEAIRAALKAGQECGTEECQVSIKLIAPPLYVIVVTTANKQNGNIVINNSLQKIREAIVLKSGSFDIKTRPEIIGEKNELNFEEMMRKHEEESSDSDNLEGMDVDIEDNVIDAQQEEEKKDEDKDEDLDS